MTATSLAWHLRRARRMQPAELRSRSSDLAKRIAWTWRQVPPGAPFPPSRALADRRFDGVLPADAATRPVADAVAALVDEADAVLSGSLRVLGCERHDLVDPDWFLDPLTGRRSDPRRYSFRVPYRQESEVGNVKQVWELSRLHHLTLLAAAWRQTGAAPYAERVDTHLRSWWAHNPFLSGINWTSGIEVGIRLISFAWIRRLLDGWSGVEALFDHNEVALSQLRWHQEYLAAFVSTGSSGNNHLVAEAAGLLVAACAFPWYAESAGWETTARQRLLDSLTANTFPSGVNRELATDYHGFVAELALVAALECELAGRPLDSPSWTLLARMADAAASVVDCTLRPPRQGDGDDGRVLVVDGGDDDTWASFLGVAAAVLQRREWWPEPRQSVKAAYLGVLPHPEVARELRAGERADVFDDAGITLLRTLSQDRPEIWCRCDGGPHGFLSIAAHAHADALSLEVRHDGVDVLADPGTYCYHGDPQWRSYFRGTQAHNTITVDSADQSAPGGPFLWVSQARVSVEASVGHPVDTWTAEHDGYLRLDGAVSHRRRVALDERARCLTVTDLLTGAGVHDVCLSWHLGPSLSAALDGARARLAWKPPAGERRATLWLPDQLAWSMHRGETEPVLGWYSPSFGVRVPAVTLVGRTTVTLPLQIVTKLVFDVE